MASGSTGWDTKTYEYIKKFYDTQAWLPKNAVIVNKKAFDQLDDKSKKALLKAGQDAEQRVWKVSKEKTQWYMDNLSKNGMENIKPTDELMKGLDKVGANMRAEWIKRAGTAGQKVNDRFGANK